MLRLLLSAFLLACGCIPSLAIEISGNVRIIDGDTLQVGDTTVRLHGIDAAESGQRCVDGNKQFVRPGDFAEDKLQAMAGKGVICKGSDFDDFGRLIAVCTAADGQEINSTLVEAGLAWAFVKYSDDYVSQETVARESLRGVWSMACEPPWIFREKRWDSASQKSPKGCPIKGNISERGRIYHAPWSRHYTRTSVNEAKGERWFCSEGEAIKAGWRAPVR
jgi:endonuclease YncB( thermonuclease family)